MFNKRTQYKIMFWLIKKIFIGLLTRLLIGLLIAFNYIKRVLLSNQRCMTKSTLINLHPNKYSTNFTTIHLRLN